MPAWLRPDSRTALLFALFSLVALGGFVQASALSGDQLSKPFVNDLLAPLPVWALWMYLLVPLAILSIPLRLVGLDPLSGPFWFFALANCVYFYLLSCALALCVPRGKTRGV